MARTTKQGTRYKWVTDFGPGTEHEAKTYTTMSAALKRGETELRKRKTWAERYAHDTVQDIEAAITRLLSWREYEDSAYFEPCELSTYVDRHTNSHVIIRLKRITKET